MGCADVAGAQDGESIRLSEVSFIEGTLAEGTDPRSPTWVRSENELTLHYQTSAGDHHRVRTSNGELGNSVASKREGTAQRFIDWIPDELDLAELPPEGLTVSSSRWRNGRLLENGEPIGWCPELATSEAGEHRVIFDRYDQGDYDVILRTSTDTEMRIAGLATFEANASLAVGRDERVYVAWDEGSEGFGHGGGLHKRREIQFGMLKGEEFFRLPLPGGRLAGAKGRASEGFSMAELPRLVVDENGVLWLFFRAMARWNRVGDGGKRGAPNTGANRRVVWEWRAAARSDKTSGWSRVVTLPQSDGPGTDGLAVVAKPGGGVVLAYETDARLSEFPRAGAWEESLSGDSRIAVIELDVPGTATSWIVKGSRKLGRFKPKSETVNIDPAPELVPDGWVRMWGDLHRHSDLSRCKMDEDGNQLAQYRYAVDIGALDFVALTEHYQHLSVGQWAYSREMAERFNRPGSFATLFGFEQAQTDGHRNLFTADPAEALDGPFRKLKARDRLANYPADDWIAIPHQLADPKVPLEWAKQRARIECQVEIYQSRRGAYFSRTDDLRAFHAVRGHPHAIDYLREGKKFGVVAASDHVTTSGAFTAVYAREKNRAGVFEGLRSRRSYAATAKMALDVRLGELMLGEEGAALPDAPLRVRVAAGAELARVEVLRNGEIAKVWSGPGDDRWMTVRLGGSTRAAHLSLELQGASWASEPAPFRATGASSIKKTASVVRLESELGAYGECGLVGRVQLGAEPVLQFKRERQSKEVSLRGADGALVAGPIMVKVGTVRAEVRLDPEPLGVDRLEESWRPGDWKTGDWIQVRVVRTDGELAWSSPIWVHNDQ